MVGKARKTDKGFRVPALLRDYQLAGEPHGTNDMILRKRDLGG